MFVPDVQVRPFNHLLPDGVLSTVAVKFIWDDHVGIVHLDSDTAGSLAAQLMLVAAKLNPELAG